MDIDKATEEVASHLPTWQAKTALLASTFLSVLLYTLLEYLKVDTLLPLEQAQKLSLLLLSALLLLIGSYITLFFVVRAYNNKKITVTISGLNDEDKP